MTLQDAYNEAEARRDRAKRQLAITEKHGLKRHMAKFQARIENEECAMAEIKINMDSF